ncbi:IS1096 element passenger TnpR family protein [Georgenia yuyongxinii]
MERRDILNAPIVPVAHELFGVLSQSTGQPAAEATPAPGNGRRETTGTSRGPRAGPGENGGRSRQELAFRVGADLIGAKPPIWRRLKLPVTLTLHELHLVLGVALGGAAGACTAGPASIRRAPGTVGVGAPPAAGR